MPKRSHHRFVECPLDREVNAPADPTDIIESAKMARERSGDGDGMERFSVALDVDGMFD